MPPKRTNYLDRAAKRRRTNAPQDPPPPELPAPSDDSRERGPSGSGISQELVRAVTTEVLKALNPPPTGPPIQFLPDPTNEHTAVERTDATQNETSRVQETVDAVVQGLTGPHAPQITQRKLTFSFLRLFHLVIVCPIK